MGGTDGLYYYGARWYDTALGRWLSPDSIIPEAAQGVQAWSRYTYVNNAPTRYRDPTGHSVDCGVVKLGCEGGKPKRAQTPPDPPPPYKPTATPKPTIPTPVWPPARKPLPTPKHQIGPNPNTYVWGEETRIDLRKVDWFGVAVNGIGLAGDVGLITAVFGDVPGGAGWAFSTVVEAGGIAVDINDFISENNPEGVIKDVFFEAIKGSRWQRLIPIVGAAYDFQGLVEAIAPAVTKQPIYGPPPKYAPMP